MTRIAPPWMGDPNDLLGTWHVVGTSLPMWKTRINPTITYTLLPGGGMLDAVQYGPVGRSTLILGIDQPDPQVPAGFVWRGLAPITRLVTSRWQVVALDGTAGWAVTHFSRTVFTPAGIDVYSRTSDFSEQQVQEVLKQVAHHPLCAPLVGQVFCPVQDWRP